MLVFDRPIGATAARQIPVLKVTRSNRASVTAGRVGYVLSGTPTGTEMGRLRRAAVAATACTTTAFHVTTTPTRHSIKRHLYAPKGSGYVEQDEDSTLDRFRDWPDDYVPDETYEGTCVPGTARDNAPLEDLSLVANIAPHAFFEAPFHARLPANHPAMLSPWERLEKAGRFVDDDEDEKINKPRKKKQQRKTTKVEAVDDMELPAKEEKDPLFADDASDLLDAALGLDDDEDEAPPPPAEEAPTEKASGDEWLLD